MIAFDFDLFHHPSLHTSKQKISYLAKIFMTSNILICTLILFLYEPIKPMTRTLVLKRVDEKSKGNLSSFIIQGCDEKPRVISGMEDGTSNPL